jgi:hypothetical protein
MGEIAFPGGQTVCCTCKYDYLPLFCATPKQVRSGHFVPVQPTSLRNPRLVTYSRDFARTLGLEPEVSSICLAVLFV